MSLAIVKRVSCGGQWGLTKVATVGRVNLLSEILTRARNYTRARPRGTFPAERLWHTPLRTPKIAAVSVIAGVRIAGVNFAKKRPTRYRLPPQPPPCECWCPYRPLLPVTTLPKPPARPVNSGPSSRSEAPHATDVPPRAADVRASPPAPPPHLQSPPDPAPPNSARLGRRRHQPKPPTAFRRIQHRQRRLPNRWCWCQSLWLVNLAKCLGSA